MKILLSSLILLVCSWMGKKFPTLAGLMVVMPITGVLVLLWLGYDGEQKNLMMEYSRGALYGVIPTFIFYITALFCFSRNLPLATTLLISSSLWFCGALVHQLVLK
ncbi:MAG: DUF3147 family protein [Chitinispirillaceae bacterium]